MELLELDQRTGNAVLKIGKFALHSIDSLSRLLRHLCQPPQTLLNGRKSEHVEVMEDLSVDLCLLEDNFGDLAVLPWSSLHEIDHVVDPTDLQSVLLLLVAAVHY